MTCDMTSGEELRHWLALLRVPAPDPATAPRKLLEHSMAARA